MQYLLIAPKIIADGVCHPHESTVTYYLRLLTASLAGSVLVWVLRKCTIKTKTACKCKTGLGQH